MLAQPNKLDTSKAAERARRREAATEGNPSRSCRLVQLYRGLSKLGPGIVTGASDDDPSGIATYSQVGARFGFAMLWTMPYLYPLMSGVQEISAWVGRVTGAGIAANIRRYYSAWVLYPMVTLLLIANVINLGADLCAMGSALTLMVGGPSHFYTVVFGALSVAAAIFIPYSKYARLLKWASLVLLVYVATAVVVHVPLRSVLSNSFIPTFSVSTSYMTSLTAVFGTTISPYLFVWQASQEVQEQRAAPDETALKLAPEQADSQLRPMRVDTYTGMAFSNLIAFFIILDTAAVLHAHGRTNIQTATQAAEALRPFAGDLSFALFSLGIVGTGLLAVPVLAGSAGYALAEALNWPIGLDRKFLRAKGFYSTLAVATLLGLSLNFTSIDPLTALFWSAVINGVVAVPFMFMMMLMTANPRVTGSMKLPLWPKIIGWISTAIMSVVAIGMIATWNRSGG